MCGKLIQGNNIDNHCTYSQRNFPRADELRSEERLDSPWKYLDHARVCTGKLTENTVNIAYMFEIAI